MRISPRQQNSKFFEKVSRNSRNVEIFLAERSPNVSFIKNLHYLPNSYWAGLVFLVLFYCLYCISWDPRDYPVDDILFFLSKKQMSKMGSLIWYLLEGGALKGSPFNAEINEIQTHHTGRDNKGTHVFQTRY